MTPLQAISEIAREYQDSILIDPEAIANRLEFVAKQLSAIETNIPVNIKRHVDQILETRDLILYYKVGQLAFWEQMVKTEKFCLKIISTTENQQDKIVKVLGDFYPKLFKALQKNERIPASMTQEAPLRGNNEVVIQAYLEDIKSLIEAADDMELTTRWIHILEIHKTEPEKAMHEIKIIINALNDYASIEELEEAICSTDKDKIRAALLNFSISALEDKVRILKKGVEKTPLNTFHILMNHECFTEMTTAAFDEVISHARKNRFIGHALMLEESDGYKISQFALPARRRS